MGTRVDGKGHGRPDASSGVELESQRVKTKIRVKGSGRGCPLHMSRRIPCIFSVRWALEGVVIEFSTSGEFPESSELGSANRDPSPLLRMTGLNTRSFDCGQDDRARGWPGGARENHGLDSRLREINGVRLSPHLFREEHRRSRARRS